MSVTSNLENPLGSFVRLRREFLGIASQSELARRSRRSQSYIGQLEQGFNPKTGKPISPTLDAIDDLALALKVSPETLGQIARGQIRDAEDIRRLAESEGQRPDHVTNVHEILTRHKSLIGMSGVMTLNQASVIEDKGKTEARLDQLRSFYDTVSVSYYGRVGCGEAIDICGAPVGVREVPRHILGDLDKETSGTVEAAGDSMNLAGIHPGMSLLVDCKLLPIDGDIVIADIPFQGSVCKRYELRDGSPSLVSESTNQYAPIPVVEGVRISGVVVDVWTHVKLRRRQR